MRDILEDLIFDNKNILILDTCILLDIVRVPLRNKISVFNSAINMLDELDNETNNFNIVIPSLIKEEWENNINNVCNKVKIKFQDGYDDLKTAKEIIEELNLKEELLIPDLNNYRIERLLKNLSKNLLDYGYTFETEPDIIMKAYERVRKSIPPSKPGKDSTKDCTIYEETLEIGKTMRENGFKKKIVFASSNTKEYYKNRKLISHIEEELKEYNIDFVSTMNWGYNEVK